VNSPQARLSQFLPGSHCQNGDDADAEGAVEQPNGKAKEEPQATGRPVGSIQHIDAFARLARWRQGLREALQASEAEMSDRRSGNQG